MIKISSCLLKPPDGGKYRKVPFPKTQQNDKSRFQTETITNFSRFKLYSEKIILKIFSMPCSLKRQLK